MELSSTSTLRTYRHLRLAVVGAAVMMLVALVIVTATVGSVTSLSALYYTPGRTVFTGALFAIALALVALSGHSLEQVLLDIAAPFAVLIAVVPTPIEAGDVPHALGVCSVAVACVPATEPTMQVGVIALAVMGILAAATAVTLAASQRWPSAWTAVPKGVWVPAVIVALVSIGFIAWLSLAPQVLLARGHDVATGVFFGIMVAVSVISAITAERRLRVIYIVVAAGMVASLLYLTVVIFARVADAGRGQLWVLVGEIALLVFFAVFWLAQTAQKWNELDPAVAAG
ncbi:MAG: hypothetical protein ABI310_07395 [Microbacteriaceae bacterium]